MGFKENLRDELFYKGISIKELSILTGISQGSLSNYLKEKSSIPSADIAVKIATALNTSVEYLVTKKEHTPLSLSTEEIVFIEKFRKLSARDKIIIEKTIELMLH